MEKNKKKMIKIYITYLKDNSNTSVTNVGSLYKWTR